MNGAIKKGLGFGLTSGIITTLGLMVGLSSSTHSKSVVLSGILIIAIADALSDAFGMHMSEESDAKNSQKKVWESTISTFFFKFVFALTFVVPVLIFDLNLAIIISVLWGLFAISIFSYDLAIKEKIKPYKVMFEHISIAIFVIIVTHFVGLLLG
ncbi:MAG: hypothetical protein AB7V77_04445 [Candidatus Woesearchaeota archaeon]